MKVILYVTLGLLSLAAFHVLVGDTAGTLIWFLFYTSCGFKLFEGKRMG